MVRPHLEYANSLWIPYKKEILKLLERYRKELLYKLIISLKHFLYTEIRLRGSMIEVFIIVHDFYHLEVGSFAPVSSKT